MCEFKNVSCILFSLILASFTPHQRVHRAVPPKHRHVFEPGPCYLSAEADPSDFEVYRDMIMAPIKANTSQVILCMGFLYGVSSNEETIDNESHLHISITIEIFGYISRSWKTRFSLAAPMTGPGPI